jgi:hypothetical protein
VLFLDDDTLIGPGTLRAHRIAHAVARRRVAHGDVIDLSAFKFSEDAALGAGQPILVGAAGRALGAGDLPSLQDRAFVDRLGPRRRRIERLFDAAATRPELARLRWIGCIGTNTSIPTMAIRDAGSFEERFGRRWGGEDLELGFRLASKGVETVRIEAPVFHLPFVRRDTTGSLQDFWDVAARLHGDQRLRDVAHVLNGSCDIEDLARQWS